MLKPGDYIYAITEDKELIVEQVLPTGFTSFDFSAKYTEPAGIDLDGNKVYGNRGFLFEDEGIKWNKLNKHPAKHGTVNLKGKQCDLNPKKDKEKYIKLLESKLIEKNGIIEDRTKDIMYYIDKVKHLENELNIMRSK